MGLRMYTEQFMGLFKIKGKSNSRLPIPVLIDSLYNMGNTNWVFSPNELK